MSSSVQGPKPNQILEGMMVAAEELQEELSAEVVTSKDAMQNYLQEAVFPFPRLFKSEKALDSQRNRVRKAAKGEGAEKTLSSQDIDAAANRAQKKNPELKSPTLLQIRGKLSEGDSPEEIIKKILESEPDVTLADDILDFLAETTKGELAKNIKEAKELLNKQYGREIAAGRTISAQAREAAAKGLGTPTNMRELYRDITGNPRDSTTLFQELSKQYAFKDLKKVLDFLLHSLGTDLKSKGPSIPRGQLYRLLTETRSLQAILGVYRFFRNRMGLVDKMFEREGLTKPAQLNFETMSKEFMGLAGDRYPSGDKVLQTAVRLGIEKWIMAKIIALSQFRDAIREVAINQIYRSLQHRDDLYLAILEALEELEDELEALLDEEDEEGEEEEGEEEKEDEDEES